MEQSTSRRVIRELFLIPAKLLKSISIQNFCSTALLSLMIQITGCTDNIREESAVMIAEQVKPMSNPDGRGLTWFAPDLHISHYRTLFYGYDTLKYRLTSPENQEARTSEGFRLLIDAAYGGNLRHYDFARWANASTRIIDHLQHVVERCEVFNSLTSSCLYRDRFSLALTRTELEQASLSGLQLVLASDAHPYEQIDLPSNYIQGFLKAIKNHSGSTLPEQ
jgi:hypothetical protein